MFCSRMIYSSSHPLVENPLDIENI